MNRRRHFPHASGFSLVEVLVALVIGSLAMVVVLQVFWLSEGTKRTSTSGSDAQQGGSMGLYLLERDLRQAGYGMNAVPALGCTVVGYDKGPPVRDPIPAFVFAPVVITQGATNAPDTISISYGSDANFSPVAVLTQANGGNNANYQVTSNFGFTINDLIIVTEVGNPQCTLAQVNEIPPAGGNPQVIHNTGVNSPRYNKASGMGVNHGIGSRIYNLGKLPVVNIYSVTTPSATVPDGRLNVQNTIIDANATPIVDGVVNLQAEYGMDDGVNNATITQAVYAADDGIVDNWTTTTPATPAAWAQVLAVRLAVVARSGLREKPDKATGQCNITASQPTWAGSTTSPIVLGNDSDGVSWKCYRYRVYETTVPLRNMIWRPS